MHDDFSERLKRVERRVASVSVQLSGVLASELSEALREIRLLLRDLAPEDGGNHEEEAGVLFVDDEEIIRRIGTQILTKEGFKVFLAKDGIEAVGVYEQNKNSIKCVVLDLVMPRMDGIQAFRQLRRANSDLGILLMSGYRESNIRKKFEGLEFQGFLRKPFSAKLLTNMVSNVIRHDVKDR